MDVNWRSAIPVLVPEAHAFGMIGVVRSLGRAGYVVHAMSSNAQALGLRSRYASHRVVSPAYADPRFLSWLESYLGEHSIRYIVPSEGFLIGTRSARERLLPLYPHVEDAETLYRCISKTDYLKAFVGHADVRLRQHLPATRVFDEHDAVSREEFSSWRYPAFVKADGVHGRDASATGVVWRADDATETASAVTRAKQQYRVVLAQEFVSGVKATVNLLLHRDEVIAESMCVAEHENPYSGGLTAYRRTWWNQEMREDALRRMRALGWNGPVMVEYRWDWTTRAFKFLELNARYWAALNMDLLAGTDFPRIQLDHVNGRLEPESVRAARPLRCRLAVPADVGYLISSLRAPELRWPEKLRRCAEFVALGLDPRVKNDLWFPGDSGLYWRQMWSFVRGM